MPDGLQPITELRRGDAAARTGNDGAAAVVNRFRRNSKEPGRTGRAYETPDAHLVDAKEEHADVDREALLAPLQPLTASTRMPSLLAYSIPPRH